MSELISGKDAKLAWANGEKVQRKCSYTFDWKDITSRDNLDIFDLGVKYRRKPRTIKLNGIEVPVPFEPKDGDVYFYMTNFYDCGYDSRVFNSKHISNHYHIQAWRSEEEIRQVVAALRQVFGGAQ